MPSHVLRTTRPVSVGESTSAALLLPEAWVIATPLIVTLEPLTLNPSWRFVSSPTQGLGLPQFPPAIVVGWVIWGRPPPTMIVLVATFPVKPLKLIVSAPEPAAHSPL